MNETTSLSEPMLRPRYRRTESRIVEVGAPVVVDRSKRSSVFLGTLLTLLVLLLLHPSYHRTQPLYVLPPQTSSPVIGILAQPYNDTHEHIASSYPKWLEAGGARSFPIPFFASQAMIEEILPELDAVLLPGGGADYPETVTWLLDRILQDERYIPVWGTCLGFEFLVQYVRGQPLEYGFDAENISLPLENVQRRELYSTRKLLTTVTTRAITLNNHHLGIAPSNFTGRLAEVWHVTSTNVDRQGNAFVSSIEPQQPEAFPFYGVQYHPEKNAFEYATAPGGWPYEAIDHSPEGIDFAMHMASFFVGLARRKPTGRYTGKFPYVFAYPTKSGLAFEERHLIPKEALYGTTM